MPRKYYIIDSDIDFSSISNKTKKMTLARKINPDNLWPNTYRMHPGDVFLFYDDRPKNLALFLGKLCVKKTGKKLKDNGLLVKVFDNKKGLALLKY